MTGCARSTVRQESQYDPQLAHVVAFLCAQKSEKDSKSMRIVNMACAFEEIENPLTAGGVDRDARVHARVTTRSAKSGHSRPGQRSSRSTATVDIYRAAYRGIAQTPPPE